MDHLSTFPIGVDNSPDQVGNADPQPFRFLFKESELRIRK